MQTWPNLENNFRAISSALWLLGRKKQAVREDGTRHRKPQQNGSNYHNKSVFPSPWEVPLSKMNPHHVHVCILRMYVFFINSASPVTSWTWTSGLTCITIALPSNQMMWRKTDKVYGSAKPSQIIRPLNTDVLLKACFNFFFFFLTDHVLSWICSSVERLTTVGLNHVWVEKEVQAGKCIKRRGST